MPLYDGVVSVDDGDIDVIIGIEDDRVRMSSGGSEIGEWDAEDFRIELSEDGVYAITAENESLRFVPNEPGNFARVVPGYDPRPSPAVGTMTEAVEADKTQSRSSRVLMWAVATGVGGFGVWALVTML